MNEKIIALQEFKKKKETLVALHGKSRARINNQYESAMRLVRNDYNKVRAQLKQEYREKLELYFQKFEADAKPIIETKRASLENEDTNFKEWLSGLKQEYQSRRRGKS